MPKPHGCFFVLRESFICATVKMGYSVISLLKEGDKKRESVFRLPFSVSLKKQIISYGYRNGS